jgi:hypothetical protein
MTQPAPTTCPHLGLASDRTLVRTQPDAAHRCYAQTPIAAPDEMHQAAFCLSVAHPSCPHYVEVEADAPSEAAVEDVKEARRRRGGASRLGRWLAFVPWIALALLLIVVAVVYGRDLLQPPAAPAPIAPMPMPLPSSPSPLLPLSPSPPLPRSPAPRLATSTSEPGGQVLALSPRAGDAGWWASGEGRGNHLGDSYLYAGYFNGQAFVAAARFELARVPRGAPIREATLRLTGLKTDRFQPGAGGVWQVQLLAGDAVKEFARADFQALFNAAAGVTLFPAFYPADLGVNRVQELRLDASARAWLAEQIVAGAATVTVRIVGPASGDTLFAWDSGSGPATAGNGPQLILNLGPAPATPPPLPTQQVIIATLTTTPANVLTAAAKVLTATAVATTLGTYTPVPYKIVTPTPIPANLATAQALGYAGGLPPIVPSTPTPANAATATYQALYATAVAVTTGTFTPVPTDAVTPIAILPTPVPTNIATAAALALEATARAPMGTATPLPYNAVIVTLTPRPFEVTVTPTAANIATALARAEYATAVAVVIGTFTPLPPEAIIVRPTAVPLLIYLDELTPTPQPPPTPTVPAAVPAALVGKVLFRSDRFGEPRLFALDPVTGRLAQVTQSWPYQLALAAESRSPDGRFHLLVQEDNRRTPQIYVHDSQYNALRQLTATTGWSYDPVWSPRGDRIAFVSQEPGNDEIYLINPDGDGLQRLTVNSWEWDKHPSWSPDGTQIVFWSNRETGRRQLWIMNADGTGQRRLLDSSHNDWDPVWVK